jgi:hypothetical protein
MGKRADRIEKALSYAARYGRIDGDHHKRWVIDQMVRALLGDAYDAWVAQYEGPEKEYLWEVGSRP